jgi:Ca-activated chloride channel family protein
MMKKFLTIGVATLLIISVALSGCSGTGGSGSKSKLNAQEASETLDALLSKINVSESELYMDLGEGEAVSASDELPDISTYPLSVTADTPLNIEIFSSTEKAGTGKDGWFNEIAERFNSEGFEVGGQRASVSIRPIASGLALDYITTGKYRPEVFSPANELWASMIEDSGVALHKKTDRLAGNTAGILMKKSAYNKYTEKFEEVTLDKVIDAVISGDLVLGYTNPYASSTGLNILTAILKSFDSADPLSETAVTKLIEFQASVPPVAFTTAQMRESAKKGVIDTMVMEYQAYINEPTLKDYVFTPMGVRHDSPVYTIGDVSAEKQEVLKLFTEYCLNPESQAEAKKDGFNANDNYKGVSPDMTGAELINAQHIWKDNKDAGRPVAAVFVADTSGSMEGTPIAELMKSLVNASTYIGDDNYVGLVSYSDDVYIDLPIDAFTGKQRAYFNGAVKNLSAAGGTATYDAVLVAAKMLLDKKSELPDAKLMMFVLSDGEQNEGFSLNKISPVIGGLNIPVHTIGYNANLEELAELSAINEGLNINADDTNVVYNLKNVFNANL